MDGLTEQDEIDMTEDAKQRALANYWQRMNKKKKYGTHLTRALDEQLASRVEHEWRLIDRWLRSIASQNGQR